MLKLVDYNSEKITVVYTDCNPNLNKVRVQSIILETAIDDCNAQAVEVFNYGRDVALFLLGGKPQTVAYYNLNLTNINKFNLKINVTGAYIIQNSTIGSNIIEGNQILEDFKIGDKITIGAKTYTVDKSKSSQSRLFLTEPLVSTSNSYKVALIEKVSLFPMNSLRVEGINHITGIKTSCCSEGIDKGIDFVSKFMALEQAIKCNNVEKAELLYTYLNEWS